MTHTVETLADLRRFAADWLQTVPQGAVVGLTGDLGAGKTAFVREVVGLLAPAPPRVVSPSFVLHQHYELGGRRVDHFDLYRLDRADEAALMELGYFEIRDAGDLVFVEWPERAEPAELLGLTRHLTIALEGTRRRISDRKP